MNRRQQLLAALDKATPTEQRRILAELDSIRDGEHARIAANREVDLFAEVQQHEAAVADARALQSVGPHTAATDWLAGLDVTAAATDLDHRMVAEAQMWWNRTSDGVKADAHELRVQAQGMAQRTARRVGATDARSLKVAKTAFLGEVGRLCRIAGIKVADADRPVQGEEPFAQRTESDPWSLDPDDPIGTENRSESPGSAGDLSETASRHTAAEEEDDALFERALEDIEDGETTLDEVSDESDDDSDDDVSVDVDVDTDDDGSKEGSRRVAAWYFKHDAGFYSGPFDSKEAAEAVEAADRAEGFGDFAGGVAVELDTPPADLYGPDGMRVGRRTAAEEEGDPIAQSGDASFTDETAAGAADVADVPTPGQAVADYPQPDMATVGDTPEFPLETSAGRKLRRDTEAMLRRKVALDLSAFAPEPWDAWAKEGVTASIATDLVLEAAKMPQRTAALQPDVLYIVATPNGGEAYCVSPDGVGLFWYDSEEEAESEHGPLPQTEYLTDEELEGLRNTATRRQGSGSVPDLDDANPQSLNADSGLPEANSPSKQDTRYFDPVIWPKATTGGAGAEGRSDVEVRARGIEQQARRIAARIHRTAGPREDMDELKKLMDEFENVFKKRRNDPKGNYWQEQGRIGDMTKELENIQRRLDALSSRREAKAPKRKPFSMSREQTYESYDEDGNSIKSNKPLEDGDGNPINRDSDGKFSSISPHFRGLSAEAKQRVEGNLTKAIHAAIKRGKRLPVGTVMTDKGTQVTYKVAQRFPTTIVLASADGTHTVTVAGLPTK